MLKSKITAVETGIKKEKGIFTRKVNCMMKRIKNKVLDLNGKFVLGATVVHSYLILATPKIMASGSNTSSIDPFITFICDWLIKIGAVVMMVGAVMFALGWQREDAEGKTRGLQTLMAGAMVMAIGKAPDIFGL